jgi:hypothetical protein
MDIVLSQLIPNHMSVSWNIVFDITFFYHKHLLVAFSSKTSTSWFAHALFATWSFSHPVQIMKARSLNLIYPHQHPVPNFCPSHPCSHTLHYDELQLRVKLLWCASLKLRLCAPGCFGSATHPCQGSCRASTVLVAEWGRNCDRWPDQTARQIVSAPLDDRHWRPNQYALLSFVFRYSAYLFL